MCRTSSGLRSLSSVRASARSASAMAPWTSQIYGVLSRNAGPANFASTRWRRPSSSEATSCVCGHALAAQVGGAGAARSSFLCQTIRSTRLNFSGSRRTASSNWVVKSRYERKLLRSTSNSRRTVSLVLLKLTRRRDIMVSCASRFLTMAEATAALIVVVLNLLLVLQISGVGYPPLPPSDSKRGNARINRH